MKTVISFKQFTKPIELPPIHFKYLGIATDKREKIELPPIHFKYLQEKTIDETPYIGNWTNENDNSANEINVHPHKNNDDLSKSLSKDHKLTPEQILHIKNYTRYSRGINEKLIKKKKLDNDEHKTVSHLTDAIHSNPLPHDLHSYSGVSFDPTKQLNNRRQFKSKAFISTTHSKHEAIVHAAPHSEKKDRPGRSKTKVHILHIHSLAGTKALHVQDYSKYKDEHETIFPPNTSLQHHGHTDYRDSNYRVYRIHHMSVVK